MLDESLAAAEEAFPDCAGGGELSPSKSRVLLLLLLPFVAPDAIGEARTAEALLSSSCGLPAFGLWPEDCGEKIGMLIIE